MKLPKLSSLGSFKVSASVSEVATSRLGLGSEGLVHIPGTSCQWPVKARIDLVKFLLSACSVLVSPASFLSPALAYFRHSLDHA